MNQPPPIKPLSPRAQRRLDIGVAIFDGLFALVLLFAAIDAWAPPQDLFWKPLSLDHPMGLATKVKFAAAARDPEVCRKVLNDAGLTFNEVPADADGACGATDAIQLHDRVSLLSPPAPVMTCSATLAYAFWERHTVQPAAETFLGSKIRRVDHFATSCESVYSRPGARASEGSGAYGADIDGFQPSKGLYIAVGGDFRRKDKRGRFLRAIRDGGCQWFHGVLSPDYNRAHRDHFHLDFGPYRICS